MSKIEDEVGELAEDVAAQSGYEIVDVQFGKEAGDWYLRIFIDKESGVDLDDCERFSRAVDAVLEEKDPIPQAYHLEVSSPGIERPLKKERDFIRFRGETVCLHFFEPIDGKKEIVGTLGDLCEGSIAITAEGKTYQIAMTQISKANLYWEF